MYEKPKCNNTVFTEWLSNKETEIYTCVFADVPSLSGHTWPQDPPDGPGSAKMVQNEPNTSPGNQYSGQCVTFVLLDPKN